MGRPGQGLGLEGPAGGLGAALRKAGFFESGLLERPLVVAGFVFVEVAALTQGLLLAPFLQLDVVEFCLCFQGPAGGWLDAALLLHRGLACGQLVFHRHHA